jgi:hypothetical protein
VEGKHGDVFDGAASAAVSAWGRWRNGSLENPASALVRLHMKTVLARS